MKFPATALFVVAAALSSSTVMAADPTVAELAQQVTALQAQRDALLETLSYLGVGSGLGAIAFGFGVWRAARSHVDRLIQGIGSDLTRLAEGQRLRDAAFRREVVIVSETAQLGLWRSMSAVFPNLRCATYDETRCSDMSGKIVVCVPTPAAGEGQPGRLDFTAAAGRMEQWIAGVSGVSTPHAVMVQGGVLPAEIFARYNAAGVYISQAPIRLQGDIERLLQA